MTTLVRNGLMLALAFALLQAGPCLADTKASVAAADVAALASQPLWLDLLHVNRGGLWHGRGQSTVSDPDFFLAANGARDPRAELQADIAAFRTPGDATRCRFPGRYKFLAHHLGWREEDAFARCPRYVQWRQQMPIKQAVVVFPVGTMAESASMFGHLFLRLDTRVGEPATLMARTVGFLTATDPDDADVVQKFKGLTGGYVGRYVAGNYLAQLNQYSDIDSRDIWEYRLNLTPAEISRLLDHVWALQDIESRYFFLDANCAYQLLALVQVARPQAPLIKALRLTQPPVNAVRRLQARGYVTSPHYRPSAKTKLDWQAQHVNTAGQALAVAVKQAPDAARGEAFQALYRQARFRVANLALTYFDFATRKTKRDRDTGQRDPAQQRKRYALLRLVHANTPADPPPVPTPAPPEAGHDTHLWALAAGRRGHANFVDLKFRYTYHDVLDNPRGFKQGAGMTALGLTLRAYQDAADAASASSVQLQSLQLLSMHSLVPRDRFVQPTSWFAGAGLEQVRSNGADHLAGYVQGGPGLAWRHGDFMPYVLARGRLEYNRASGATAGAGVRLGVLYYHGRLSARFGLDSTAFTSGDRRTRLSFGANWALNRDNALRLNTSHGWYRRDQVNELSLAWRHYF